MTSVAPETVSELSEDIEPREPERSAPAPVPVDAPYLHIEL